MSISLQRADRVKLSEHGKLHALTGTTSLLRHSPNRVNTPLPKDIEGTVENPRPDYGSDVYDVVWSNGLRGSYAREYLEMTVPSPSRVTDAMEAIQKRIKENLRPMIGKKINRKAKREVVERLKGIAAGVNGKVTSIGTLWDRMTWRERVKWWVVNRLAPFAGKEIRRQHEYGQRTFDTLNDTEDAMTGCGPYEEPRPLPSWAEAGPKTNVVMDYEFTPVVPCERIVFTTHLTDEPPR